MKRFIAVIVFALALTACASINNPLSPTTMAQVETAYGAALSVAVGYRDACAQRLIPPACRPIVKQIQVYGQKAQAAVLYARSFVKNNPTVDASTAIRVAQDAVAVLTTYETTSGVK